ncbi:glycosyl transferase family 2 [Halanaerobium sp. MA284_MarDTE_T2]|nr:glycosyl transferase family 2 [Halanaerobium sp. MA284_MarDTE_T2]
MIFVDISALIPAYNEEKQISGVLTTLIKVDYLKEIVVVNDGSKDKTAEIASSFGVKVITLQENRGKAAAVMEGIKHLSCEIVVLLDADLIGLKKEHIDQLVEPMLNDDLDMCVGILENSSSIAEIAQQITPTLSGQRAVKKHIFYQIENLEESGFGIELALNKYVKNYGRSFQVKLNNVSHVKKEKKFGFLKGFVKRLKMYLDIIRTFFLNLFN